MPGPLSSRWRALRAAAFSAVATQLAAVGHVVGGGGSPDFAVLVVGAGTVGLIGTGLAGRQRGWPAIFGVLAACQLAFHLLFGLSGHVMAGGNALLPADPARMLLFHLLAAAFSALVLAKGESSLFGLFAALRRCLLLLRRRITVDLPPRWTSSLPGPGSPRPSGALLRTSPRRGPPALLT